MQHDADFRMKIVEIGALLWQRGLIGACEGNLSCRLKNGNILATPAGKRKGKLDPTALSLLSPSGAHLTGELPSSEIRMHLRLYRDRPDCNAVVHAHPPHATAFAVAAIPIPYNVLTEAATALGPVAMVPYATPGTDELPDAISPFIAGHHAFLLANHGATTIGADLDEAYDRMETLERVAHVIWLARALGTLKPIP